MDIARPSNTETHKDHETPSQPGQPGPTHPPELQSAEWLSSVLDEIDYGVLVIADSDRVIYANHTASSEMRTGHPLKIADGRLETTRSHDARQLQTALQAALKRSLRGMVQFEVEERRIVMSVTPIARWGDKDGAALILLGKTHVCQTLSTDGFARCHGLSPTESAVLTGLSEGKRPSGIARAHGVALSTVRAQIANIRLKTGTTSIAGLVAQMARLPPLVGALRH